MNTALIAHPQASISPPPETAARFAPTGRFTRTLNAPRSASATSTTPTRFRPTPRHPNVGLCGVTVTVTGADAMPFATTTSE